MQQHPTTNHELQPAELAVLRALVTLHDHEDAPERFPRLSTVAHVARMTYAATVGAVRQLAYVHGYVIPRDPHGMWVDGVSITTTGRGAIATAAAELS